MRTATTTPSSGPRHPPEPEPTPARRRPASPRQSVAIVHDYINQCGGAERVALELARVWPGTPIYTSLYRPVSTFPEFANETCASPRLTACPSTRVPFARAAIPARVPEPRHADRRRRHQLLERLGARRPDGTGIAADRLLPHAGAVAVPRRRAPRPLARAAAAGTAARSAAPMGPGGRQARRHLCRQLRGRPPPDPHRLRSRFRTDPPTGRSRSLRPDRPGREVARDLPPPPLQARRPRRARRLAGRDRS